MMVREIYGVSFYDINNFFDLFVVECKISNGIIEISIVVGDVGVGVIVNI